jgi:release factor glutamine methyltransferase
VPGASGLGVDKSAAAVEVARRNAKRLGLDERADFIEGNWADGIEEFFDLVVSNPPYIPTGDIGALAPEVARFEPLLALDGGRDGLAAYRIIAGTVSAVLAPGGVVCLEVGAGQAEAVAALLRDAGLTKISVLDDLARINRCVCAVNTG